VSELVALAEKFVRLSNELEATRGEMRRLLLNGAGGEIDARPTTAGDRPGKQSAKPKTPRRAAPAKPHPAAAKAAEIEERIMAMLKERPGMRVSDIAKATASKTSTTVERMKRLKDKGMAASDGGAWTATQSPL
jgi:hypothetical protein